MANMIVVKSFYIFCLLFTIIVTVDSIRCYRCSSTDAITDPYQCNEKFEHTQLSPQSCDDVYNAQYCIKQIGRFEGGLGTKRFCSSADLGNYCNYVRQPGDLMEYRSCYFTCAGDGCNSAVGLKPLAYFLAFLFTSVLFFFY